MTNARQRDVKAIFFDIDGTLVSFQTHKIPDSAMKAIQECRARGIKVFIATGRPLPFIDNLGTLEHDGIVCYTGAHCQLTDGTVVRHCPIPKADVIFMYHYAMEHGKCVFFAGKERVVSTPLTAEADEINQLLQVDNYIIGGLEQILEEDTLQIIPFITQEEEDEWLAKAKANIWTTRWHPMFVDAIASGNCKSAGIDAVIQHFGIGIDETMAFGDGGNDIDMLQHVGLSVAMGNASDDVKAHATFVTDTVDDDGVAKALHTLILDR